MENNFAENSNQQNSQKREEEKLFSFKDTYGEYQIPEGLKLLIDQNPDLAIQVYITRLAHTASSQIDDYKGREDKTHFTPVIRKGQNSVETSTFVENISRVFEGKEGIKNFIDARDDLIASGGRDFVLRLESFLGVDSRGVEAGDEKPLLGVNERVLVSLAHYHNKMSFYDEIK